MKNGLVQLAHGSGGRLSHELMMQVILPAFANDILDELSDGAKIVLPSARLAFSTDSYVVKPLFFAGGDIGKLAVCGTVNDLAVSGATPRYLSAGFIIEEGFPLSDLSRIVQSMRASAGEAGVKIVTGDTKVVEKGAADGIFINTAGVGELIAGVDISPRRVRPGQEIILSGCPGEHSIAIMAGRHGLTLPAALTSDCAPLNGLVKDMLAAAPAVAMLRDPTRGGVATALNEIALQAGVGIVVEEAAVPVRPEVSAVCDLLGFDPLYLANEGKLLAFVEPEDSAGVLTAMRAHSCGRAAVVIGQVTDASPGRVSLRTTIGGLRLLDMLSGDQLPRIC
jgi:hydrogenase expression/formation protein HypE